MEIVKSIGAVLLAVGVIAILSLLFNKLDKLSARAAKRARERKYRRKFREGQATIEQWCRENKVTIEYDVPKRKHRNTYFHSEECAAAYGGKYIPKGESL